MAFDAHKNFAYSLVATAPSPASSGTSLVVTASDGTKFPAVPFNATIWPAGATPISTNAEIVRVTAISTDTLTITRAQESTSARTVVVGDQIAATVTAQTVTDVEAGTPTGSIQIYGTTSAPSGWLLCDGSAVSRTTYAALFTAISTNFGTGDGSTTFNVPDLRGRSPVGYVASGGHTDVSTMGNGDAASLANRRPKHNHTNSVTISGAPGVGSLTIPDHIHSPAVTGIPYGNGILGDGSTAFSGGGGSDYVGVYGTPFSTGGVIDPATPPLSGAPSIGSLAIGGTVGPSGTNPVDSQGYLVVNYIIKT